MAFHAGPDKMGEEDLYDGLTLFFTEVVCRQGPFGVWVVLCPEMAQISYFTRLVVASKLTEFLRELSWSGWFLSVFPFGD